MSENRCAIGSPKCGMCRDRRRRIITINLVQSSDLTHISHTREHAATTLPNIGLLSRGLNEGALLTMHMFVLQREWTLLH